MSRIRDPPSFGSEVYEETTPSAPDRKPESGVRDGISFEEGLRGTIPDGIAAVFHKAETSLLHQICGVYAKLPRFGLGKCGSWGKRQPRVGLQQLITAVDPPHRDYSGLSLTGLLASSSTSALWVLLRISDLTRQGRFFKSQHVDRILHISSPAFAETSRGA